MQTPGSKKGRRRSSSTRFRCQSMRFPFGRCQRIWSTSYNPNNIRRVSVVHIGLKGCPGRDRQAVAQLSLNKEAELRVVRMAC